MRALMKTVVPVSAPSWTALRGGLRIVFEDWEAISLIRQNVYEDEPTGLADLSRSATRTERDECFDMLEQVETGRPL